MTQRIDYEAMDTNALLFNFDTLMRELRGETEKQQLPKRAVNKLLTRMIEDVDLLLEMHGNVT